MLDVPLYEYENHWKSITSLDIYAQHFLVFTTTKNGKQKINTFWRAFKYKNDKEPV